MEGGPALGVSHPLFMVFREYATKDVIVAWNAKVYASIFSKTMSGGKF